MTNQPPLPELPPMKSAESSAPAPLASASASTSAARAAPMGTKRLRQIVGSIAGGGLALVAVVCAGQLTLRPELQPTTLLAEIEAGTELGIINQKMGFKPGARVLTEADYQRALAQAQREGQAKVELGYQRDLAVVQADKERVVGAYQTLYQRTAIIAQGGIQMEQQALQFRQQLLAMSNGGRAAVISVYDMLCALGNQPSCDAATQARAGMIEESSKLSEGDLAKKIDELMAGIPDPAALVADEDQRRNGTPALPRR